MSLSTLGVASAMRRTGLTSRQAPTCLICNAHRARQPARPKASCSTRNASSKVRPVLAQDIPYGRSSAATATNTNRARWLASQTHPQTAGQSADGKQRQEQVKDRQPAVSRGSDKELSSLTNMMAYVENSKAKVLGHRGVPPEAQVSAALRACQTFSDYIMDESVQPQISHLIAEGDTTAANLLSLDSNGHKAVREALEEAGTSPRNSLVSAQLRRLIDRISESAYAIIEHPAVFITPILLRQYVKVQATLGRPETLPRVFQLYVTKPIAQEASGSIKYTKQNPNKVSNAVEAEVTETALDTAIEAKNLDAAVGIIENTYTTKAFIRSKLLRKATLPMATFAATPLAAYGLARNFSVFQDAMDAATATNVAFAGILAYVGFTASIGVVAVTTANDQMKRVTWAPGVALRSRWVREEERAALDKIACAWGFAEQWRQGEEEGPEWDALREYIGQKGMVLDRTELMEGME